LRSVLKARLVMKVFPLEPPVPQVQVALVLVDSILD
jgi:hypothetical protein